MRNFRFNYIITIHNKQDLIQQVMEGILTCCRENSFVYPVLDGCTDNTEKIIDEMIAKNPRVLIRKLYAPDVHELKTINTGLRAASQNEKGCNIILQDDIIIDEPDLENLVYKIYEYFGYNNIGYLSFRHGVNVFLKDQGEIIEYFRDKEKVIEERDLIESVYGYGMSPVPLPSHKLVERMVTIGSPQCISCEVVNKIGIMDEQLAPVSYSCHDISLRCLEAGLHNYTFALRVKSEMDWGGTRTDPNPKHMQIMKRNQLYLYQKHKAFLQRFRKSKEYYRLKLAQPFYIPGILMESAEQQKEATEKYYLNRSRQYSPIIHFFSKYIKLPLKRVLILLRLY